MTASIASVHGMTW